jgi:peptide/nickel transport system permease protein
MLTMIALRGALPSIGAGLAAQSAALLGGTALVEHVFSWGGLGQYGLEAMAKADFAAVQGFILASAALAALVHGLHALVRRLARIRIRRA